MGARNQIRVVVDWELWQASFSEVVQVTTRVRIRVVLVVVLWVLWLASFWVEARSQSSSRAILGARAINRGMV